MNAGLLEDLEEKPVHFFETGSLYVVCSRVQYVDQAGLIEILLPLPLHLPTAEIKGMCHMPGQQMLLPTERNISPAPE